MDLKLRVNEKFFAAFFMQKLRTILPYASLNLHSKPY